MRLDWLTKTPIAHRGLHGNEPLVLENTLPAFERAALQNYTIYCDVQLSHDGVPVVFHGVSVEQLTGQNKRIIDLRLAEIANIVLNDNKQHIITFEEMLKTIAGKVPILVNLEGNEGEDAGLISRVTELLVAYPNNAAIMSQNIHLLRRIRFCDHTIPHGIKAEGNRRNEIEEHFAMLAHDMEFVAYNFRQLANPFVRFAREKLHMPVLSWTIHNMSEWERARKNSDQMIFEGFQPE
ncbi:glycerophosphodiester phosphodiesterase family protein [uncultured Bartonella sp.]|uniref:glycerophosphodiester phosphodiesterase family protein n=1 Tax=uncultured Bartonella sp. TaxID=104108 RepID=UPI00262FAC78|nr:glycerophosphodiester phosphodiesterase family protein [uncultured Bartonella sp.]